MCTLPCPLLRALARSLTDRDLPDVYSDPSGKPVNEEDGTATAILKKKKKPNQLM